MNEHGQLKKETFARTVTQIVHSMATDIQSLSKTVRSTSKQAAETHTSILNRLLLVDGIDFTLLQQLLTHLLHIIEFKGVAITGLAVLSKVISLVKMMEEKKEEKIPEGRELFEQILNILVVASSKQKDKEIALRVVQNSFSLIEPGLLQDIDYHMSTRLYLIIFGCCLWPQIQSISTSALFSLTDLLFKQKFNKDHQAILIDLLEFLLHNRKTLWVKDLELKGIVWDLVLIIVRNISEEVWADLSYDKVLVDLLNQMYRISMQNSFSKGQLLIENDFFKNTIRLQHEKPHSNHQRKDLMIDYIKYYKVFIYFSIHLSLALKEQDQIVPFRKHINAFHNLYDYPRSIRFYILLQGIVLILSHGNNLILQEEGGIMLVDVFQKVCQQLYSSKLPFQIVWENSQLLIENIFVDYSKVTDQDYLKVTKNMLVRLRKAFENNKSAIQMKEQDGDLSVSLNADSKEKPKETGLAYRWRRLIKSIIRIIRYLTTLNFKQNSNDQAIRRFLMELQNWFMLCPTYKTRNTILIELQHITSNVQNQNQAIKASQCMQICANILYGFYGLLNSVGISTIIRIMANIKVNYLMGKDFNELEEVSLMADKFYIEQRLIGTQEEFTITVEGIVQCMNLLVADMQLPSQKQGRDHSDKYLKLIDFVLLKLKFVLQLNVQFLQKDLGFILCFWGSMCSSKQINIQSKILCHIESVYTVFVKNSMVSEKEILGSYLQLAKLNIQEVSKQLLIHIKNLLFYFKDEKAFVLITHLLQEFSKKQYFELIKEHVFQIEEMIIKESLFKIRSIDNIGEIIKFLNFKGKSKNEQYGTVSFLWTIADHLKTLHKETLQSEEKVWKQLFKKIIQFAKDTDHPGTRQSCIHTFTQIMADCNAALGEKLFFGLLTQEYVQIFCLLMGFDESVPKLQNLIQVEMQKMAIKNLIKLVKKCLNEGKQNVSHLLQSSLKSLLMFIQKSGKIQPIEYYLQLCELLLYFKELEEGKDKYVNHFQFLSQLISTILFEMQKQHNFLDQSTFLWKKKYFPVFQELKTYYCHNQ